jgi:hypothetical protein
MTEFWGLLIKEIAIGKTRSRYYGYEKYTHNLMWKFYLQDLGLCRTSLVSDLNTVVPIFTARIEISQFCTLLILCFYVVLLKETVVLSLRNINLEWRQCKVAGCFSSHVILPAAS